MGRHFYEDTCREPARIGLAVVRNSAGGLRFRELLFLVAALLPLSPWCTPSEALLAGLMVALTFGNPFGRLSHRFTSLLLQAAIVGLGFGIDFSSAMKVSSQGLLLTVLSIASTLAFGSFIGVLLGNDRKASYLVASGTAICGGSAIAAVAPVIDADDEQVSMALGTVFLLNAVALFLFPAIGKALHMSQTQFGMWAAIAIHDTSSVVGAAGNYGAGALRIATTVKLARSLWIVPVAAVSALLFRKQVGKVSVPWFIGLFVIAMLCHSGLQVSPRLTAGVLGAAGKAMSLSLFLIGSGFSLQMLRKVGWKSMLQGVLTWMVVASATLFAVLRMF